jgi:hypothetical protein
VPSAMRLVQRATVLTRRRLNSVACTLATQGLPGASLFGVASPHPHAYITGLATTKVGQATKAKAPLAAASADGVDSGDAHKGLALCTDDLLGLPQCADD